MLSSMVTCEREYILRDMHAAVVKVVRAVVVVPVYEVCGWRGGA